MENKNLNFFKLLRKRLNEMRAMKMFSHATLKGQSHKLLAKELHKCEMENGKERGRVRVRKRERERERERGRWG